MPLFLLSNWRLIAEAIVVGILIAWLGITKYELNSLHLAIAEQKTEAQKLIADKQAEISKQIEAQAEFNRKLEAEHESHLQDIAKATDDFNAALAQRVRQQGSRVSCPSPGSPQAPHPTPDPAMESAGLFLPTETLRAVGTLMQEADETAATMNLCKAWAQSVGK